LAQLFDMSLRTARGLGEGEAGRPSQTSETLKTWENP
jgi:hypothetical protein